MDSATWGFVGVLAGSVVGALASIATTWITNKNDRQLQKDQDSLERKERARAFQRETLIGVQEKLQVLFRMVGKAHYEQAMAYKVDGQWGRAPISEEVNQGTLQANQKLLILTERVADDGLRSELKKLRDSLNRILFTQSEQEAEQRITACIEKSDKVMEDLGVILRGHY